jgi:hypothetical protein
VQTTATPQVDQQRYTLEAGLIWMYMDYVIMFMLNALLFKL